jgi:probable HAF family extracellular repeat protein
MLIVVLSGIRPAQADPPFFFMGLGHLSFPPSHATGISADGTVAVGDSGASQRAFRWTTASGMVPLGVLPGGGNPTLANGVSDNGMVIVGRGASNESAHKAFRWTAQTGMVDIGDLPGGIVWSQANAVSGDGAVVVGQGTSASGNRAFRWTSAGGMTGLDDPSGTFQSSALGASGDGSVVVGSFLTFGPNGPVSEPFRWTAADGMVGLGYLSGAGLTGVAHGVSADGSVVVGASSVAGSPFTHAFRWTSGTGMVDLGDLAGIDGHIRARAVTPSGSIVVGDEIAGSDGEVFIWDATHGMRNLSGIMTFLGLNLTGWDLLSATDVSADGTTIVGYGINPDGDTEAWIAHIPEPTALALLLLGSLMLSLRRCPLRRSLGAITSQHGPDS